MRIVWEVRAQAERLRQINYVARADAAAAERLDRRIDDVVDLLATFPHQGRPSSVRGVRELVISRTNFVAFYQVQGDVVRILRFFHGRQRRPGQRRR